MHIYINASYTFIYTCKHTNRLHPNIFTSNLSCYLQGKYKKVNGFPLHKQNTFTNTHGFFLAFFRHLHPSLRACFPTLKFKEHFLLTVRAIQWSSTWWGGGFLYKLKLVLNKRKKEKNLTFLLGLFFVNSTFLMYGPLKLLLRLVQPDEKRDLLFHQSDFLT